METTAIYFSTVLLLLELFEMSWQRGKNLYELISSLLMIYKKSLFFFIALHPTFYYVIFISITLNVFSLPVILILLLKFSDMALKITLLDRIKNKKDLGFLKDTMKENIDIPPYFRFLGAILYPPLLFFALQ